jgi:hypothetical protein
MNANAGPLVSREQELFSVIFLPRGTCFLASDLFIFRSRFHCWVRKGLCGASLNGIKIDVYFWCRGLLASKMYETAKGIVTNLIHFIEQYGHVLNGARAYYTNRR